MGMNDKFWQQIQEGNIQHSLEVLGQSLIDLDGYLPSMSAEQKARLLTHTTRLNAMAEEITRK